MSRLCKALQIWYCAKSLREPPCAGMPPKCRHQQQTRSGSNEWQQRVVCTRCRDLRFHLWADADPALVARCLEAFQVPREVQFRADAPAAPPPAAPSPAVNININTAPPPTPPAPIQVRTVGTQTEAINVLGNLWRRLVGP